MKNKVIIFFVSIFVFSIFNYSQSLQGIKICIDPGHGGHDSNDRYIAATGFWESEGNLTKAFKLKEYLEGLGAEVILTRTENNTSDDLPLSQRAAIANSNNADFFHSIHSNGYKGKSNYTVILYNGTSSSPTFAEAKEMGGIMTVKINDVNRTTAAYNRADREFLGYNLGVLKPLAMPGTLSEGSFHDYIPESYRLKNENYLHHEARAIQRAFLKYFEKDSLETGVIAGIVRDPLISVPADYYPVNSADSKKAINNVTVTIPELNKTYVGDYNNNGFYSFDAIEPGSYKVIIKADNYAPDSAFVTVEPNTSSFLDMDLDQKPNLDNPSIVTFSPGADSVNVSNVTEIAVNFSIRMNAEKTEAAFSISPEVSGSFRWEEDYKKMIFKPTKSYTQGNFYQVNISDNAESHFGIKLDTPLQFNFSTRSDFNLISNYPSDKSENISQTLIVKFEFDHPISSSSLSGNISFKDQNDKSVSVKVNTQKYSDGIIEFEPRSPLNKGETYKVFIGSGLYDNEYVKLNEDINVEFTIENTVFTEGVILNDFEDEQLWIDPADNQNSVDIKKETTSLTSSTIRKIQGSKSLQLSYGFTSESGKAELSLKTPKVIDQSAPTFALWVFGDNSKNILQCGFVKQTNELVILNADTLNWTGWKLVEVDLSQITNEELKFTGISIEASENFSETGIINFDAAQTGYFVPVEDINKTAYSFDLEQNFPNPFNPSTVINYTVPENSKEQIVKLFIYNILGEKVSELVNKEQEAGTYSVTFNANNLSSGIYFAQIKVGEFAKTIKMNLIK